MQRMITRIKPRTAVRPIQPASLTLSLDCVGEGVDSLEASEMIAEKTLAMKKQINPSIFGFLS